MSNIAAVVQGHTFFKKGGGRFQDQFHFPLHAINTINIAHPDRGASVLMGGISKVHRGHRNPVMGDREVVFHAECGPRSAIPNLRLLDGRVGIEHRLAADLVDAGI